MSLTDLMDSAVFFEYGVNLRNIVEREGEGE